MQSSTTTSDQRARHAAVRAVLPDHLDRLTWSTEQVSRHQREQLRRTAVKRTRLRRRAKIERGQQLRFLLLIASIALTVVVVTVVMFETLAWLMG